MSSICAGTLHLCRLRVTRLDSLGNVEPGPNNYYVTDHPIQLAVTPMIEAGVDRTLVGGCDCIDMYYHGYDKLKGFTFTLDQARFEPELLEIMTGASLISQGGSGAGNWWRAQTDCSEAVQPNIAVEGWQDTWEDDHPAAPAIRYTHWVWPSSFWQIAAHTLGNDFTQPQLTGFSRANPYWGLGPYGDFPEAAEVLGGYFRTDQIPTALCDYQTVLLT